jgi:transposase-like protein
VLVALVWRCLMLRRKVLQICCSAILGEGLSGTESPVGERAIMLTPILHCPYCQDAAIVCHGTTSDGPHCSRCRAGRPGRGRTFLLAYTYAGRSSEVKQQSVEMALNARGMRDTARVLHVSPTTVMKARKKN